MQIKVSDQSLMPTRANPTDAGLDLRTAKDAVLHNGVRTLVGTGVRCKVPYGHVGLLVPRSSLSKNYVYLTNSVGIIDSDYRGEIMASLIYEGSEDQLVIPQGERIVQLVITPIALVDLELSAESEELWNDTSRGVGGFGSSGKN